MATNFTSQMIKLTHAAIKEKELKVLLYGRTMCIEKLVAQSEVLELKQRLNNLERHGSYKKPTTRIRVERGIF